MITAVVVFHSDLPALQATLDSLAKQCDELLLVDVSPEGSGAGPADRHGATLIPASDNKGYGWACNLGIAQARGSIVLVSNADITYRAGSVSAMAHIAVTSGGLVTPIQFTNQSVDISMAQDTLQLGISPSASAIRWLGLTRGHVRDLKLNTLGKWKTTEAIDVPGELTLSGASVMATAGDWSVIGGFDEAFFLYQEDAEITVRTRDLGLGTWVASDAHVTHSSGTNQRGLSLFALSAAAKSEQTAWHIRGHRHASLVLLQGAGSVIRLMIALLRGDPAATRIWYGFLVQLAMHKGRL